MKILVLLAKLAFLAAGLLLIAFLGYLTFVAWAFERIFYPVSPTFWEWMKWYQGFLIFGSLALLSVMIYAGIIMWYVRHKRTRPGEAVTS